MNIFVDNDVILDVLLKRKDFQYSQQLLSYIEEKRIHACTSPMIFTNSFYKLKNKKSAWSALKKIRLLLSVSTVSEKNG